jgi:molybdate transport system substrate-binding protein
MMVRILVLALVLATLAVSPGAARAQVEPWSCGIAAASTPTAEATPSVPPSIAFPEDGGELTVFAAASLTDAFTQIATDISASHPNVEITFNFAGSQALVTQLSEGGAEADVLALASPAQMTAAIEAGVPVVSSEIFARNQLAVVVPADNPAGIASVNDLAGDDIRLVLANPDVPAGNYARQSLCKVAGGKEQFLEGVADNVVSEEENVRAVLTKVQLGEADAGIVYVTDALTARNEVAMIEIPAEQNVIASYPIATLTDDPLAAAFVSYVRSAEGQATLASFGFEPIN